MILKTKLKRLLYTTILCTAVFAGGLLFAPQTTITVAAQTETLVQPLSDVVEWKYKIEDGKMYKRLYNLTKNCWEGDWIYVCDYPQ